MKNCNDKPTITPINVLFTVILVCLLIVGFSAIGALIGDVIGHMLAEAIRWMKF